MFDRDFPTSFEEAEASDVADPLAQARSAFVLSDGETYLVGHSLGPATHHALSAIKGAAEVDWASGLVGSWNTAGWIDLPKTVGQQIANLIGVQPDEVIVCDSVSINLFKIVGALLQQKGMKRRVIVETGEFPTDQYILERLARLTNSEFVRVSNGKGAQSLDNGGVLVRSLVDYRSAEIADVESAEACARRAHGAIVWDLSHATGVLDLNLARWRVRYAVGCTYKYLNGGPGAPAFIFVARDNISDLETPLAGWLGHARPFEFEDAYEADTGMQRFVAGTPPILSMSALSGALKVFETVSLCDVEQKARRLGDMCLSVFDRLGLPSISPPIGARRGGHVSISHRDGYAISRALAERGHKTDFRTPDTIRFGLSPLYLRYTDVWRTLETLETVLSEGTYLEPRFSVRSKVT